ncbi:hypothetical protein L1987_29433 [Smallanthus sonchifolius]|uniref:Uncharacterized protein n=1 Tax=Smallanthus sonchifolius TaxID=185202 RepID=A0ACB9HZY5_9ASTR|nr:hypothetical protein L1987_29433 [Smallanthus sonchifolius]
MSSSRHSATARNNKRDKRLAALVAKQMAQVIPGLIQNLTPNRSVESNTETPNSHTQHYRTFLACRLESFTGLEGATKLLSWFASMENTFSVSETPDHLRTRYAASLFKEQALAWWDSKKELDEEIVTLSWKELKALMREEYCPPHELQALEEEFFTLKQDSGDNAAYNLRFQQLSVLAPRQVDTIERFVAKYIQGLPSVIKDTVAAAEPTNLAKAMRLAAAFS